MGRQQEEIRFYTGEYCPYCRRVKRELERLGLEYETVDADRDGRAEVIGLSGQRGIPILTVGDDVLVDSTRIVRELRRRYEPSGRGSDGPASRSSSSSLST